MTRKHLYVSGRVQGVGFRYFARQRASICHVSGYARNLDNGMVEMEVQGEETDVERYLRMIRDGNTWIVVETIWSEEMEPIPESGFYTY